jgi:hypothetical protein
LVAEVILVNRETEIKSGPGNLCQNQTKIGIFLRWKSARRSDVDTTANQISLRENGTGDDDCRKLDPGSVILECIQLRNGTLYPGTEGLGSLDDGQPFFSSQFVAPVNA